MRKNVTVGLLVASVGLTALLSIANIQSVTVNYLFGTFKLPLILLILLSVGLGMFIQFLLGFFKNMSLRQEIKKLKEEQVKVKDTLTEKEVTAK
ncbi:MULTISPECIES: lipopolysaccharide assembly protein LapA domain-containing protein [Streptococcus]|uniref:Lipopolysaccharide assembly protein LapA domain-containing protein n=1 Tax=Streptococcus caledonicus TaxID=2614158 RepID=A0ABW0UC18_9STRE|nr:lipopolysaccharide assembly protein LapA domain-containing protein [Streptococcus sp. S784/96/1]